MEIEISKAQTEVWEWKQKAYEEIKDLSPSEQMKFIHEQTKEMFLRIKETKNKKVQGK